MHDEMREWDVRTSGKESFWSCRGESPTKRGGAGGDVFRGVMGGFGSKVDRPN